MPASPAEQRVNKEESIESPRRSSALQRLVQIFNWRSSGGGGSGGGAEQEEEEEEESSLPPTPLSSLGETESLTSAATPHDLLSGFTPVQNYLESRKRKLTSPTATGAGAAATTPYSGSNRVYLTNEPSLAQQLEGIHHEINPTAEGSRSAVAHRERRSEPIPAATAPAAATAAEPAVFRAGISPELMREALDLEAAEIAGMDPTGSLVVDVLSKKLARMAAKEKRRQARKQQQERQQRRKQHQHLVTPTTTTTSPTTPITPADSASSQSHSIWSRLVILFHDPSILSFFTIATLLGFGHGVIGTFLFMYLKQLGAGEGLMGWVLLANALPELPVFYFFGTILRVVGMDTLLLGSTAVLSIRIAAYSLFNTSSTDTVHTSTTNSILNTTTGSSLSTNNNSIFGFPPLALHWIYLLETLHAITYAVGWSACALNASKIAPPGLESTTQAVFQGLWSGIGAGTGGLLGGFLYHWKGPDALFLCSAAVIAVGCGVSGVVLGLQHKKQRYQRQHGSVLNLQQLD
jgi:hypothetical protein